MLHYQFGVGNDFSYREFKVKNFGICLLTGLSFLKTIEVQTKFQGYLEILEQLLFAKHTFYNNNFIVVNLT